MLVIVEQSVEWKLVGETEVLGEKNLPDLTRAQSGPPRWEASDFPSGVLEACPDH
jgi:hypothetical protein